MSYWILEGHTPTLVSSVREWADWFESADRQIALTKTRGATVSTVFLGLDVGMTGGSPLLFETMIFGGLHSGDSWRFETWEDAEFGHVAAVALVEEK